MTEPAVPTPAEYLVEMVGQVREVYAVSASSSEEAAENWASGDLVLSEAFGMELYNVREDD